MKRPSTLAEKRSVHSADPMPKIGVAAVNNHSPNFADTMPKIGVAAADVHAAKNISWLRGVSIMALSAEGSSLQLVEEGSALPLISVPVQMLGFLVLSKAGEAEIEHVRSQWRNSFRLEPPPAFDAKAGVDRVAILTWQSERLISLQRDAARRNTVLMRDLAAVRAAHEETQEAFRRLEAFAAANLALTQQEALTLEPTQHGVRMANGRIVQRMPLNSVGISDVALHIRRLSADIKGALEVRLRTVEDDRMVGKWTIPAQRLRPGWVRLSLPEALGVDEQSLEVIVNWDGEGELVLSLSTKHPDERWCARQGGRMTGWVLALQVWRGMPRTRSNRTPGSILADDASITNYWIMDVDTLRTVELINGPTDHVAFIDGQSAILVHPTDQTPTIARIPRGFPALARHVWAQVEIAHPEAAMVEYALAVSPVPEGEEPEPHLSSPNTQMSEWHSVPAGKKAVIHLFLPEPAQAPADLYLATRMPPGATSAHCQAHFSLIRASV